MKTVDYFHKIRKQIMCTKITYFYENSYLLIYYVIQQYLLKINKKKYQYWKKFNETM